VKPYYEDSYVTLWHGDCRELLSVVAPASVDMIWTDPPYGHGNLDGDLASSRVGVRGGRQVAAVAIQGDGADEWPALMGSFLAHAARVLKPDCCCCCCCCCTGGGGPTPAFARLALWLDERLAFFHAVVWDKSGRGNGLGWRYRRNYEFVMVAHQRGGKLAWADDSVAVPNIVRTRPVPNDLHPTTKPIDLSAQFIGWHTRQGDLVLDPFAGSGTTLRAAKNLRRRAIGIEIEERYCEIAAQRCSQETLELGA
jgi:site-specific DNA-methyltransferase (adenine-specific)